MFTSPTRFIIACSAINFVFSTEAHRKIDEIAEQGRQSLVKLKSQLPRYGECWTNALNNLESGCKRMSEDVQGRMALSFANCFLAHSGSQIYPCDDGTSLKACLKDVSDRAFNVYTEFFTHTQHVCFFLQSQVWHEETSKTVSRLTENSAKVSRRLDDAGKVQDELLVIQRKYLKDQKEVLDHGSKLHDDLETSRLMVTEMFAHVSKLQSLVLGEFTGFYTIIFYAASALMCYLLTSSKRTADARFWLFLIISVNAVVERYVSSRYIQQEFRQDRLLDSDGPTYVRIWICRKVSAILGAIVLMVFAYRYKDLNAINNDLLNDLKKQMDLMLSAGAVMSNGNNAMIFDAKSRDKLANGRQLKASEPEYRITNTVFGYSSASDDSDDSFTTVCSSSRPVTPLHFESNFDGGQIIPVKLEKTRRRRSGQVKSQNNSLVEQMPHRYNLRNRTPVMDVKSVSSFIDVLTKNESLFAKRSVIDEREKSIKNVFSSDDSN